MIQLTESVNFLNVLHLAGQIKKKIYFPELYFNLYCNFISKIYSLSALIKYCVFLNLTSFLLIFRPQYQGGGGGYQGPGGGYGGYPAGGGGGNQTVIIQDRGGGGGNDNFGTGLLLGSALGFGLGKVDEKSLKSFR